MTIMELHKALSYSIGDGIEPYMIDSDDDDILDTWIIPDGVRFREVFPGKWYV